MTTGSILPDDILAPAEREFARRIRAFAVEKEIGRASCRERV